MSSKVWDVIVVGAGPGGLQAAIAAASEGLEVLVLEKYKIGGQIGQTPKLENSVFAGGSITGPEFARMMRQQAEAMGATFESGEAVGLEGNRGEDHKRVYLRGGKPLNAHTVIIAVGNKWREINVPGLDVALKSGLAHFGPVLSLRHQAKGSAAVYGGGPSAGQAILALADNPNVATCHAVMRSNLNMPQYLVDRIKAHPKVVLHEQSIITNIIPYNDYGHVLITSRGLHDVLNPTVLYLCNGLLPDTDWLKDTDIELDEAGRILTHDNSTETTTFPGVYAIGDCRSGSTARVGVAIGDGSMAVTEIWTYFSNKPVCRICPQLMGKKTARA